MISNSILELTTANSKNNNNNNTIQTLRALKKTKTAEIAEQLFGKLKENAITTKIANQSGYLDVKIVVARLLKNANKLNTFFR